MGSNDSTQSLIAMSFILLSYTVLSKNRFSFMDSAFCLMTVAYVGIDLCISMKLVQKVYITYYLHS